MEKKLSPKIILDRGLKPKKSFGQNFMMDQRVNLTFVDAARSIDSAAPIVEIGAGTGSLTQQLLAVFPLVHAIERDRDLVPILRETFAPEIGKNHLVLHEADGARFALETVLTSENRGILLGNLPYHLTSSIVLLALKHRSLLKGAVFLVQKEVADRLAASPNSKDYGLLTVLLHLTFDIKKVMEVDKAAFWPQPKIDSAIIKCTAKKNDELDVELDSFLVFVREIFQKRRKKISTILAPQLSKEEISSLLVNPDFRPENLTPQQFIQLYKMAHRP